MIRALGRAVPVMLVVLALAAPAAANHVQCGDVITQDTTLDSDLTCTGVGVVVEGDVTLDMAGHTIRGSRSEAGVAASHGIVEVRGGSIEDFGDGVFADGVQALRVEDMLVRGNGAGVRCAFVPACSVVTSTVTGNAVGVDMEFVGEFPSGGTVERSVVRDNDIVGLDMSASTARVTHNRIEANGTGIDVDESNGIITRNVVAANDVDGVDVSFLSNTTITDNQIEDNGGNGVGVFGDHFFENTAAVVRGNRIVRNALDGVLVLADGAQAEVERNRTVRNGDDGIDVRFRDGVSGFDVDVVVRGNRADFNADLGIYAIPGVTDGGGNRARRNGNPAQCVGVACR